MYAFIRGKIALIGEQHLALDVSGVGYKISVTQRFLQQAKLGEEVVLYTHLIVREDDLSLYGFATEQEKNMFERLIGISGVGPKAGMAILSSMTLNDIATAILSADARAFSKVNGIGPKTAGRIVLELKDKIDVSEAIGGEILASAESTPVAEAMEALISLGYEKSEAVSAVSAVKDLADSAEDLTRMALKRLRLQ